MSVILQVVIIVFCVLLLAFVVRLVSREQMLLKYSLLWLLLAAVMLVGAFFPHGLFDIAWALGFVSPSNFIFFLGLFFLLAVALSLSVIVSKQTIKIKNLTQRLALLEYEGRAQDDADCPKPAQLADSDEDQAAL
ncbi:DUF2304 domain-containing protein [Thermophilibacter sp.]